MKTTVHITLSLCILFTIACSDAFECSPTIVSGSYSGVNDCELSLFTEIATVESTGNTNEIRFSNNDISFTTTLVDCRSEKHSYMINGTEHSYELQFKENELIVRERENPGTIFQISCDRTLVR